MPKSLLTDAKIRGYRVTKGDRVELADSVVDGLRLRVTGRSKTWAVRMRAGGKVRTFTIGPFGDRPGDIGLASARTKAIELKAQIGEGIIPQPRPVRFEQVAEAHTLASMVDRFMAEYVVDRNVKRPGWYRWQFDKYILPRIGGRDVRQIARPELRNVITQVRDAHGLITARRAGALLKRFFRWMASEDIIDADPAGPLRLPGVESSRDRTLEEVEIAALWKATDPANKPHDLNRAGRLKPHPSDYPWGPYFRLLMLLGQRRSEVATMRWSAVDLKAATWRLEAGDTKSARAHIVPLSAPALDILSALPRQTYIDAEGNTRLSEYVLTTNGKSPIAHLSKPKRWLDEAMAKEFDELPHWVVHDLRRTVSTNLARLGVDPFIRRRVLNHALTGIDAIYDRFDYLEPKRRALDLWAADLARIVGGHGSEIR